MDKQAVVSIKDLWAGYEADTVLEDVNFEMYQDDFVGLIGPNGGGKTTLIRVILGLLKPEKGTITVMGQQAARGRKHIGYVSQFQVEDKQFPISVWDVVAMGRLRPNPFHNFRLASHDKEAIETALEETGIADLQSAP